MADEQTPDESTEPTDAAEVASKRRPPLKTIAWVMSLIIVAVATWSWSSDRPNKPTVVEGFARPTVEGTSITLYDTPEATADGTNYIIAGASWAQGARWRDGATLPTCVGTDPTTPVEVEMGLVDIGGTEASDGPLVVWLRCV